MNIAALPMYRNYNPYTSKKMGINSSSPIFKGGLDDFNTDRVIDMLKSKVTSTTFCSSIDELEQKIEAFGKKYKQDSIGIMFVPDKKTKEFIKDKSPINTTDKTVVCLAVGDKRGPIEQWNKCYQAEVVVLPKSIQNDCLKIKMP